MSNIEKLSSKPTDLEISQRYAERMESLKGAEWLQEKGAPGIKPPQIDVISTIEPEAQKFIGVLMQPQTFAVIPSFPFEEMKTLNTAFQGGSLIGSIDGENLKDKIENAPANLSSDPSYQKIEEFKKDYSFLDTISRKIHGSVYEFTKG